MVTHKTDVTQRDNEEAQQLDRRGEAPSENLDRREENLGEFENPSESADGTFDVPPPRAQSPVRPESRGDKLGSAITELLAQKQSSRPSSASEHTVKDRKKRTLGRAPSGPTTTSSETLSRSYSFGVNEEGNSQSLDVLDAPPRIEQVVPSQALTYEAPGMQEQREKLIKQLGGKIQEANKNTVKSVGSVKDLVLEQRGVGKRVRKRANVGLTGDEG